MKQTSFDLSGELPVMKGVSPTSVWGYMNEAARRDNLPKDWRFIIRADERDDMMTITLRKPADEHWEVIDVVETLSYAKLKEYRVYNYDRLARKMIDMLERALAS